MNVLIFGDKRITLSTRWAKETIVQIFGDSHVDASRELGGKAVLTVVSIFGDTTIRVPPGSQVRMAGVSFFSDTKLEVADGEGSEIEIKSYGAFGDLKVTG